MDYGREITVFWSFLMATSVYTCKSLFSGKQAYNAFGHFDMWTISVQNIEKVVKIGETWHKLF